MKKIINFFNFINTTPDAFLGTTIPYDAREHGDAVAARKCYVTAVILFYENRITRKEAIGMFDKVLELSPNFSDADQFRQEIWHEILKYSKTVLMKRLNINAIETHRHGKKKGHKY